MRRLLSILLLLIATPAAAQAEHPCAEAARQRGVQLLRFHYDAPNEPLPHNSPNVDIDQAVRELPPVPALRGPGSFDVLEVWGYVYRASYRMRFIYASATGECTLMGEEILENASPY